MPSQSHGDDAVFRVETDLNRCRRDLDECQRRNRLGTEGVSALLAVPTEYPRTAQAGAVERCPTCCARSIPT